MQYIFVCERKCENLCFSRFFKLSASPENNLLILWNVKLILDSFHQFSAIQSSWYLNDSGWLIGSSHSNFNERRLFKNNRIIYPLLLIVFIFDLIADSIAPASSHFTPYKIIKLNYIN